MAKARTLFPFILITSLFFLWGFAHNLDPILIPHLQKSFTLTTVQATLVDSAVFIAYFLMALPAGFIMKKYGYKAGIITGLLVFALGSYLFIPAANTQQYTFFLIALFIIACGLTILETAANPYASSLGDPESSTQRLNLAQSFNGLAATLAPVIGARVILTKGYTAAQLSTMTEEGRKLALAAEAATVKMPYFILGSVLVLIAVVFAFTRLPAIQTNEGHVASKNIFHAFKHRHLTWSVIAQFFYVGAQVCVFSLFILYAPKAAGISEVKAADYLGLCGLAFLIGRFIGTYLMQYYSSARLLAAYAVINILLCIIAIWGYGMITIYTVVGICFFMSIMFPTIFALGIKDLRGDTEFGSSLIIMSIVGGAVLPRVFGYISDVTGNIQYGYAVPLICFAVVAFFGIKGHRVIVKPENLPVSAIL
ncbi:MFS transporter, FHS family, L-fucose permease [Chitinophaga ginsengisegetis]|uniref:MFS transporter, FHS family, L-fucose permease n=1 Tax=Chitinophaga ginsengisegetis TaxID=393003 RepID=A0A1T5NK08_9BACT|nr:L-fucose:H+ symporter permease [Chitinophaga ginsengisegetis]MDR6565090.1 FHS family L-fucose permease-like MFS transporter [Chitinophaga ginsengisegetis]MDR6644817.1 FHS family L-fucose permease-like MFS transporter [Chitinophaga ginsengisegetis]MDR6652591.1 FHS family L-fucose permease-like MFS transporter [Chitinophaga ginsengisegetis]SKD00762.1 MFS transporter, FHS family, L-fucose permease [Chitinophaga ginsengisegetis]